MLHFFRPSSGFSMPGCGHPFIRALMGAACLSSALASAEPSIKADAPQANLVTLSASGFLEVPQDWLTMRLTVIREGDEAVAVQAQLRQALDSAMATARTATAPQQQLQVSSGSFGVYPRYDRSGKISGWQGRAELLIEGRDFTRIARTAGQIPALTVTSIDFSLSREARQQLELDAQALAIERFKGRALEVAKGFGFSRYGLREIQLSSADQSDGVLLRQRPMAMDVSSAMSKSEHLSLEPGSSKVNVTVSGTVQLH